MACHIYWVSETAIFEGSFPIFNSTRKKKQRSVFITHWYVWQCRNAGEKVTLLTGGWRLYAWCGWVGIIILYVVNLRRSTHSKVWFRYRCIATALSESGFCVRCSSVSLLRVFAAPYLGMSLKDCFRMIIVYKCIIL